MGPTNIELEKGGAGEGGAVESLSCDLLVGERQSVVYVLEEGEGRACHLEEGEGRACQGLRALILRLSFFFFGFKSFFFFFWGL